MTNSAPASSFAPRDRLRTLLKERCYLEGDFLLASGARSNFFFDAKMILLDAEGINLVADLILDRIAQDKIKAVGGLAVGACPIATAVSLKSWERGLNIQAFYVRKEAKDHGTQKLIEGPELNKGDRVVMLEDVATRGGSMAEAIERVHQAGCEIVRAICVVDRQQGAADHIAQYGLQLESLFTRSELE